MRKNVHYLLVLPLLLLLTLGSSSVQGYEFTDPIGDMYPEHDYGDIISASLNDNTLRISFSSDITGPLMLVVLFDLDDDMDSHDGAVGFDYSGNNGLVYWAPETLSDMGYINTETTGVSYQLTDSLLELSFSEYTHVLTGSFGLLSVVPEDRGYYDWAPNSYEYHSGFLVFADILSPYIGEPGLYPKPTLDENYTITPPPVEEPVTTSEEEQQIATSDPTQTSEETTSTTYEELDEESYLENLPASASLDELRSPLSGSRAQDAGNVTTTIKTPLTIAILIIPSLIYRSRFKRK